MAHARNRNVDDGRGHDRRHRPHHITACKLGTSGSVPAVALPQRPMGRGRPADRAAEVCGGGLEHGRKIWGPSCSDNHYRSLHGHGTARGGGTLHQLYRQPLRVKKIKTRTWTLSPARQRQCPAGCQPADAQAAGPHACGRTGRADHQPRLSLPVRPPRLPAQQRMPGLRHAAGLRDRPARRHAARTGQWAKARSPTPSPCSAIRTATPTAAVTNLMTPAACSWMVPRRATANNCLPIPEGLAPGYCLACSVTRTIPDLSMETNGRTLAQARNRPSAGLISQLLALGLPVVSRHADPVHGLTFDFLSNMPGGPHVLTGHAARRDHPQRRGGRRRRARTHPRRDARALPHAARPLPPRDRPLLLGPAGAAPRRGSTTSARSSATTAPTDAAALQHPLRAGPAARLGRTASSSSYASTHPWEDWAETWAHYLHMADTADTAMSFGVDATNVELTSDLFTLDDLWQPEGSRCRRKFLDFINGWVLLTNVLNELSRSMGQPDYYPFVLPRVAVGKLQFIHRVITQQRPGDAPTMVVAGDVADPAPEQVHITDAIAKLRSALRRRLARRAAHADARQPAHVFRQVRERRPAEVDLHAPAGWLRLPRLRSISIARRFGSAAQRTARGVDQTRDCRQSGHAISKAGSFFGTATFCSVTSPAARRCRPGSPRPRSAAAGSDGTSR